MASNETVRDLFTFFRLCGRLKHLKRTGWVNHAVTDPETVSGHMYRMAMMAFLAGKEGRQSVSQEKCIKMALVHDLAESIVGDLTPSCGVSKEEKSKREREAMETIEKLISKEEVGKEFLSLWKEYEDHTSPEAIVVHDLDKFDMIFQADEYEKKEDRPGELQQFFDSTKGVFKTPEVQEWARVLETEREERLLSAKTTKSKE